MNPIGVMFLFIFPRLVLHGFSQERGSVLLLRERLLVIKHTKHLKKEILAETDIIVSSTHSIWFHQCPTADFIISELRFRLMMILWTRNPAITTIPYSGQIIMFTNTFSD